MALCLALRTCTAPRALSSLSLSGAPSVSSRSAHVATTAPRSLGVRCQFRDSDKEGKGLPDVNLPNPAEAVQRVAREAKSASEGIKQAAPEETPLGTSGTLGFTKKNELFVGRMAMLGVTAAVIAEQITGKGVFGQLNLYTGATMTQTNTALLIFITLTTAGAMWATGTRGYAEADPGQPLDATNSREVFGLAPSGPIFGFNRQNEYLNGRIAQLGFIGILFGEIATGRGPIGQLSVETSTPTGAVLTSLGAFIVGMIILSSTVGKNRAD